MLSTTRCRILYQNRSYLWDIRSPLKIGKFTLQEKNGNLLVRDFSAPCLEKSTMSRFSIVLPVVKRKCRLPSGATFTVLPVHVPEFADYERAARIPVLFKGGRGVMSPEDETFVRGIRGVSIAASILSLLITVFNFFEQKPVTDEGLVPQKYAKLILTRPKTTAPAAVGGATAQSTAHAKAIAKVFQSKTVAKSIRSILQGGLSRYSIMASGRSIQSLSEKITREIASAGSGLEKKTHGMLGAMAVGNVQVGSENGYGSGSGKTVKGQGTGSVQIGLNLNEAVVDEGLTKEEVAKVIHSHLSEIRYCYESAILNDPSLAGKVLVDFKIGAQGGVAAALASENTMNNLQVGGCLVGKLKQWKFPLPRGGVQVAVSYPFIFKSLTR